MTFNVKTFKCFPNAKRSGEKVKLWRREEFFAKAMMVGAIRVKSGG